MSSHDLEPYVDLIRSFLTNQIKSASFEREYLQRFKNDLTRWNPDEYEVLNDLFGDVDAFCSDPDLRSPGDLDEEQLRESAQGAMEKLSVLAKPS
jgi:hypothetical protein